MKMMANRGWQVENKERLSKPFIKHEWKLSRLRKTVPEYDLEGVLL
jgi:hypothetical protein